MIAAERVEVVEEVRSGQVSAVHAACGWLGRGIFAEEARSLGRRGRRNDGGENN